MFFRTKRFSSLFSSQFAWHRRKFCFYFRCWTHGIRLRSCSIPITLRVASAGSGRPSRRRSCSTARRSLTTHTGTSTWRASRPATRRSSSMAASRPSASSGARRACTTCARSSRTRRTSCPTWPARSSRSAFRRRSSLAPRRPTPPRFPLPRRTKRSIRRLVWKRDIWWHRFFMLTLSGSANDSHLVEIVVCRLWMFNKSSMIYRLEALDVFYILYSCLHGVLIHQLRYH